MDLESFVKSLRSTEMYLESFVKSLLIKARGLRCWTVCFSNMCLQFVVLGSIAGFEVLVEDVIGHFKISRQEVAWIGSSRTGAVFLMAPLATLIIDRIGCKRAAATASLVAAILTVMSYSITDPFLFGVIYGPMTGFGLSVMYTLSIWSHTLYFKEKSGFATALAYTGTGLGVAIVPWCFKALRSCVGWEKTLVTVNVLLYFMTGLVSLFQPGQIETDTLRFAIAEEHLKESSTASENKKLGFRTVAKKPLMWIFATVILLVSSIHLSPLYLVPVWGRGAFDLKVEQESLLTTAFGCTNIVTTLVAGWMSNYDSISAKLLFALGTMGCGICNFAYPHAKDFASVMAIVVANGFSMSVYNTMFTMALIEAFGVAILGQVAGFMACLWGVGSLAGPPILDSLTAKFGQEAIFGPVAAVFLLVTFLIKACYIIRRAEKNKALRKASTNNWVKITTSVIGDPELCKIYTTKM